MSTKPFIVIIPGTSQNPTHYGYLAHLLQLAGYPTFSALLPSVGGPNVTAEEDKDYVLNKMLLPILDYEERDAIILTHSYSSVPGSAAVAGLSKSARAEQGKKTGVLGQIMLAAILTQGGDGKSIKDAFGGQFPPHMRVDEDRALVLCDDRVPPLFNDVDPAHAAVAAVSAMAQGLASFTSPCPRASWDSEEYKGRVAYIRTAQDHTIPAPVQQMMLDGSGVEWLVKDIDAGHNAQVSRPEEVVGIVVAVSEAFEGL